MAEVLTASLQLRIDEFTSALAAAGQRVQQFAQDVTAKLTQTTSSLASNTTAAQANQQASSQLAAAYLAMAQAMQVQTQGYVQVQQAAGAYRKQQDELRESLRQTKDEQRRLADEAKASASAFKAAWSTALAVFGVVNLTSMLRGVVRDIKEFVTDSLAGFAQFELGLLKIASLIPAMTKVSPEFARLGEAVHALAVQTGIDTGNIQQAWFDTLSVFGSNQQSKAFEVLKVGADLAVAGFTDVNTAAKAVSSVIQEFGLQASDAAKVANALTVGSNQNRESFEKYAKTLPLLLPTLTLFKIGLEQGNAALAVTTANGLDAGKAVTGLNQLLLAIGAPTARAQKYMEELARQLGVANIEIKHSQDGVADLYATLQPFEGLKPDLMRRVFGGNIEALRTAVILTSNMAELKSNIDEAATSSGAFARQSALAHSGVQQQWKQSMQAVQVFYDVVGAVVGQHPAIVAMVASLTTAFLSLASSVTANKDELGTLMEVLAKLGQVGLAVFEALGHAAIYLAGAVGAAMQKIMAGINSVVSAYTWLRQNIPYTGGESAGPVFTFEGGEGLAAAMKIPTPAGAPPALKGSPGPVIPLGPPRTGLGLADIQAGLDTGKASKAANRDAERAAEERARITQQMLQDIAELENGAYAKKKMRIDQEIADARSKGVDVVTVARYERDMLIDLAMETTDALTAEFGKRVASATETMKQENAQIDSQRKALAALRTMGQADDPIERQRLSALDQITEKRLALEKAGIVTSKQLEEDLANATNAVNQRALDERQHQQERAAEKAIQPWRQLATQLQQTLASAFEGILSGTFSLWDSIKQGFIKLLSELAAAAITQSIIIPFAMQMVGAGGLIGTFAGATGSTTEGGGLGVGGFPEGTTGADVTAGHATQGSSTLSGALMVGGSASSLYTGISGQSLLGSSGILGSFMATDLGELGVSGAGYVGGSAGSLGGLSATTLGDLAGAAGVGIAAGQIFAKLNAMMGLHGTGNAVLSGAGGGAIAGTMIMPGIGTIVGAAVGALGGYISTLFGNKKKLEPLYDPTDVQAGQVAYDPTQGLHMTATMGITRDIHRDVGTLAAWQKTVAAINTSLADMAQQVVSQFQGASPLVQQALVAPLNAAFADIAGKIGGLKIAGKDAAEFTANLQEMMGTTLPGYFNDAMSSVMVQLQASVKKIEPILAGFQKVIDTLEKDIEAIHGQQLQMHETLQAARQSLMTTLQSPAEAFMTAQGQYSRAKDAFSGGNAQTQILLAPALAQAAQQLLSMSKVPEVLGQDPQRVKDLQTSLLNDLDLLQIKTDAAFGAMTDVLQAQVDTAKTQMTTLASGLANPATLDQVIAQSLAALTTIQDTIASSTNQSDPLVTAQVALLGGLTNIGTAQLQVLTDISQKLGGGVKGFAEGSTYIPFSQLAYVHSGERIVPASNNYSGDTIHLSVNVVGGGDDGQAKQIANAVIAEIEKRGGRYGTTSIQVKR